jgi:hypothetical protein
LIYGKAELDNEFDLMPTAIWMCEKYMSKEKQKTSGVVPGPHQHIGQK